MTETTGPVLGTVLGKIGAARKALLEILSLVGVMSGFGSLLVLVVHSLSIGYLPEVDLVDIGTALGVVLLVGLLLAASFLLMVVAPAVLMFLGLKKRSDVLQDKGPPIDYVSNVYDMPVIKAGVMISIGVLLLVIGIWRAFYYGMDQWWLMPSVVMSPAILSVVLELVCEKWKPTWVERSAPLLDRCWFQAFALIMQASTAFPILLFSLKTGIAETNIEQFFLAVAILLFTGAVNWTLLVILRSAPFQDGLAVKFVGGIALVVFVFFGPTFINVALKSAGLADVRNISLVIKDSVYAQASQYGFPCEELKSSKQRLQGQLDMCVIHGDLVTRIGKHYVMKRSSQDKMDRSGGPKNYLIIPKDLAIWVPSQ